jgi:release factor glutamine methyltransferase
MRIRDLIKNKINDKDILLILEHITSYSYSALITHDEDELSDQQVAEYNKIMAQLENGVPLPYVLGFQYFFEHKFAVSPDVLIPRPDTELLVEFAIATSLENLKKNIKSAGNLRILELGTGSGCIAISLAKKLQGLLPECSDIEIIAADISDKALKLAQFNAQELETSVTFVKSDWYNSLLSPASEEEKFDLILSNPPYISFDDRHLANLTHEPQLALTAPENGLSYLKHIIINAPKYMKNGGVIALEHGYDQGDQVHKIMKEANYQNISLIYDYGNNPRITHGIKTS